LVLKITLAFSLSRRKAGQSGRNGGGRMKMKYILPALVADRSVHQVPPMFGFTACYQGHLLKGKHSQLFIVLIVIFKFLRCWMSCRGEDESTSNFQPALVLKV
jgi:hypothetical protein